MSRLSAPGQGALEVGALFGGHRPIRIAAAAVGLQLGARGEQRYELLAGVTGLQALLAAFGTFAREGGGKRHMLRCLVSAIMPR